MFEKLERKLTRKGMPDQMYEDRVVLFRPELEADTRKNSKEAISANDIQVDLRPQQSNRRTLMPDEVPEYMRPFYHKKLSSIRVDPNNASQARAQQL